METTTPSQTRTKRLETAPPRQAAARCQTRLNGFRSKTRQGVPEGLMFFLLGGNAEAEPPPRRTLENSTGHAVRALGHSPGRSMTSNVISAPMQANNGEHTTKEKKMSQDVFGVVRAMATDLIGKANAIATDVQNSRVNVGKVVHEIRKDENTSDEKVKAYQEWLAKAEAAIEKKTTEIDAYIKSDLVKASEMSDEVYEAKKAEYAEFKKAAQSSLKLAANLPGYSEDVFADVPALMTLAGGTAGGTTGTKRPRLASLTINGDEVYTVKKADDGTESKSYTFTAAAQHISKDAKAKVSPSDLSAAAFEAAKTDDLSTVNDVEFSYSVDGKNYLITVIPQQTAE